MPCNKKTCPDYRPHGRARPGYGTGVIMSKEMFPKRDTSQINVPGWYRDAVMYNYEDKCEVPQTTYLGGGITPGAPAVPPNPKTGDPGSPAGEDTANTETEINGTLNTQEYSGKLYEELNLDSMSWWERNQLCPQKTNVGRGTFQSPGTVNPKKYRYWDHYPSELSFEANYSDTPFLYLWDTSSQATGRPCYAICWTITLTTGTYPAGKGTATYPRIVYTPRKTPFPCDTSPDATYVEYETQDGKLTGPDDENSNPLIWGIGTNTRGLLVREQASCPPGFANATVRGAGNRANTGGLFFGPATMAYTRDGGTTGEWIFFEHWIGLSSSNFGPTSGNGGTFTNQFPPGQETQVYTRSVNVFNNSNQKVAVVEVKIRGYRQYYGDTFDNDRELKITNVSAGDVLPVPGLEYGLDIPFPNETGDVPANLRQVASDQNGRRVGFISFTDITQAAAGCGAIVNGFKLFTAETTAESALDENFVNATIGLPPDEQNGDSGIVNRITTGVWSPGNSGIDSIEQIFNFEGSSAARGGTGGSGLRVLIRAQKFTDSEGSGTKITVIRVIGSGNAGYAVGQTFPIRFVRNGITYTCGYIQIANILRGVVKRGVPIGFRLAEPKTVGGVFAVTHSSWTTFGNNYAIWCNNRNNNLSGRPLRIIHQLITLTAGTYNVELGFDDTGSVEIKSATGPAWFTKKNHVGGIPLGSSTHTGSFVLTATTVVNIEVELENAPGGDWSNNPAGWAITLTKNGQVSWSTRNAQTGINAGDCYRGMRWENTPYQTAWLGSGTARPFLSAQGSCWQTRDLVVYKDYKLAGGTKIRMKIESVYDNSTSSFQSRWTIDQILSYGSGYGSLDRGDHSEGGEAFSDQQVFYLYYPSPSTPRAQRIGVAIVVSDIQDMLKPSSGSGQIAAGQTLNGWTVEAVNRFDSTGGFNAAYIKLTGSGNDFAKDTNYTSNSGATVTAIAGYGIRDRGALYGMYEFTRKSIQYATARVSASMPFSPTLVRCQATGIITNGRLTGTQITQPGIGLSNKNIEKITLSVDPPPSTFDHAKFNKLMLDKNNDVLTAIQQCQGTGRAAQVSPILTAGKLTGIQIKDAGSGYSSTKPPQIRIPFIRKIESTTMIKASTSKEELAQNGLVLSASPGFKNSPLSESELYNKTQFQFDKKTFDKPVADITELDLDKSRPRKFQLPKSPVSPKYMGQFKTSKSRRQFTDDVKAIHTTQKQRSEKTSKDTMDLLQGKTKNKDTVNYNQDLNKNVSGDSLSLARGNVINPGTSAGRLEKDFGLNTSKLDGTPKSLTTGSITKSESTNYQKTAAGGGAANDADYYPQGLRDVVKNTKVDKNSTGLGNFKEPKVGNGPSFNNASKTYSGIEKAVNTVPITGKERTGFGAVPKNFDKELDQTIKDFDSSMDTSAFPQSDKDRTITIPATPTISTVVGGFYKLPCATDRIKYLIQSYCPDPRANTIINVVLGVQINENLFDATLNRYVGRCERCLLNTPAYVTKMNQITDPDKTIVDGFCATVWTNSIHNVTSLPALYAGSGGILYGLSGLRAYQDLDNVVYEGIHGWEINGNLEILHDNTAETRTFVSALNKYGNPYDFFCNRSYGDLKEDEEFALENASLEEDNQVPDQLANTNPALI